MAIKFSIPKIFRRKNKETSEIPEVDEKTTSSEETSAVENSEKATDNVSQNSDTVVEDTSSENSKNEKSASKETSSNEASDDEKTADVTNQENPNEDKKNKKSFLKTKWFILILILFIIFFALCALGASTFYTFKKEQAKKEKALKKVSIDIEMPKKHIEPIDRSNFKVLKLDEYGTANPFNPNQLIEVPKTGLQGDKTYLTPPPSSDMQDPEAGSVMSTTISGILYDGANSSAIINIEGIEYFVKQNDSVNNYSILSINPNQVKIKYGNNIYKAGVGELLTKIESNSNIVNLNRKFGGNFQDSVAIKVRKN